MERVKKSQERLFLARIFSCPFRLFLADSQTSDDLGRLRFRPLTAFDLPGWMICLHGLDHFLNQIFWF